MRWKQAVTAEEVALYAFDLEGYKTLEKAKNRTIDHIINYLKTEQTTYEKY